MTVLCGGISDGMLWDLVDVQVEGVTAKTLRPMVAMTPGDLCQPADLFGLDVWLIDGWSAEPGYTPADFFITGELPKGDDQC